MSNDNLAPIIVKKKKVVEGGGHHGGAWKVAYADFVTAMMAFFLLMWLLNATTEKQRKGLSDYFSPTVPVNDVSGGGEGQFWGDNVLSEEVLIRSGQGATQRNPTESDRARGDTGVDTSRPEAAGSDRDAALREAENLLEHLQARGGESMAQLQKLRYVTSRLTEEGLVFDIFETDSVRLFEPGTSAPTEELRVALRSIAGIARIAANDIAVRAHLAAQPIVVAQNPVWDLSMARAQSARQTIQRLGLPERRIRKVVGYADREPVARNPMDRRNTRIEIVFLREDR